AELYGQKEVGQIFFQDLVDLDSFLSYLNLNRIKFSNSPVLIKKTEALQGPDKGAEYIEGVGSYSDYLIDKRGLAAIVNRIKQSVSSSNEFTKNVVKKLVDDINSKLKINIDEVI